MKRLLLVVVIFFALLCGRAIGQTPPAITTTTVPSVDICVNSATVTCSTYSFTFTESGITAPIWAITSSDLPAPPWALDPTTGTLTGNLVPSTALPSFYLDICAKDSTGACLAPGGFSLAVNQQPSFSFVSTFPTAYVGQAYPATQIISAMSGGTAPYTFSAVAPPGMSLSSSGILSGTPTVAGPNPFTVKMTDSAGTGVGLGATTVQQVFPLTVAIPLAITSNPILPVGEVGLAYTFTFTSIGGTGSNTWSSTALPGGLQLNGFSGVLSGTPTASSAAGSPFSFTVTLSSFSGLTQQVASLAVNPALAISSAALLPNAGLGKPYSQTLTATGGVGTLVWSQFGTYPPGLSLSAGGVLSGTPTKTGSYGNFGASVTDSYGVVASRAFQLTVAVPLSITSNPTLPVGEVGVPYTFTFTSTGGLGSNSWTSGVLPAGLKLTSGGVLGGTPTTSSAAGSPFSFTVTLNDFSGQNPAQQTASLAVNPALSISTASPLPNATAGSAYSQTLTATGGVGTLVWSQFGTYPPGLTLSAAGVISGTPSKAGSYGNFGATVVDSYGVRVQKTFQMTVLQTPAVVVGVSESVTANTQPTVQVSSGSTYPADITGTLTLTFASSVGAAGDGKIMFANGTRTLAFTIPANTTSGIFGTDTPMFQAGTTAGTITLTVTSLQSGGQNISAVPVPVNITIPASAPQIVGSITAVRSAGGFTVTATGFCTARQVTTAKFTFAGNANLRTTSLTEDETSQFTSYYGSPTSIATGTEFTISSPFTISGNAQNVTTVTLILTGPQGDSSPATATIQ